jgi:preprotein translocase subunit SecE
MLERIRNLPNRVSSFTGDVRSELRKVTWPNRKEIYGTTIVVLVTVFFFGIYLFLVDSALQVIISRIIRFFL